MKATARPVFGALRSRGYSAQAAADQATSRSRNEPKVSRLPNGATVAAVENYSPVARLAIVFNAGSRYDPSDQPGLSHYVRNATNLASKNATAFGITKNVGQMGADLTATTTREHLILSMNVLRDQMYRGLEFLSHIARFPAYKSWEVRDMTPTLKLDKAMYHSEPDTVLMEALHEVAFRNGLSNSLYIPDHKIGAYNHEDLEAHADKFFTPANMAVVALGTDPEEFLFQLKQRWNVNQPAQAVPPKEKSVYGGGERRVLMKSPLAHAAVVTEGASLGSKDLIPLALLQRILGTGPSIKYSDNVASKITIAASEAVQAPFAASAINVNYSDSGLFGFYAVAEPKSIGAVLKACAATFGNATKGQITDKDLARAKGGLKASVHLALENGDHQLTELSTQAILTGQLLTPAEICAEIDRATVASVQDVAKRVINGKPSMAAVGDLSHTPYLDQIL